MQDVFILSASFAFMLFIPWNSQEKNFGFSEYSFTLANYLKFKNCTYNFIEIIRALWYSLFIILCTVGAKFRVNMRAGEAEHSPAAIWLQAEKERTYE